ncbi:ATP-dependent helicase [Nocardioides sp. Root190]|uniref:ATP-dependent helicase n=1 Tax=Nocardioides sp. Root190 TaxID=1736488 RepID=UPI000A47F180|nr:ATP-dependent DNA helicase [Nocardioides sp. Root190]
MDQGSGQRRYVLKQAPAPGPAPELDEHQRSVVDHPGGPLLVLAGPGTGKTTTLVEAIVDRIERRGADPDSVLALTFSRKAADQLRDRVSARLGRTTGQQLSSTFHSFAYALVRRYAPAELYEAPLRLLSAPEQDVVLRELLTDHPESVRWPDRFRQAMATRGFAREVHAVIGRAREKGLDGHDLRALGEAEDLDEYVAAGLFLEQYLDSLDSLGATDYADLIRRARIEAEDHREELRARFQHVFVDEYQDTDPGQVALLRAIAGDGRNLVVVGDPHQSIYAFRGAEVRGILEFPTQFPQADGAPADVVALQTTRRFGADILGPAQRIAARLPLHGSIPAEVRSAFLAPRSQSEVNGLVQVRTFDTERAEVEHLADMLRRAHLEDGMSWDDMAVLVRSGRASLPALRRGLAAAGVPVDIARDEIPLVQEPAVASLLAALRAVADPEGEGVEELLAGPLGGLDATEVRALTRRLRAVEPDRPVRELLRAAVFDADATALGARMAAARELLEDGASAEAVLWALWDASPWQERLTAAIARGGPAARLAHRDLDALCALFEAVARVEEQRDHTAVETFLDTLLAQEVPGDTLAERGVRGASVRLLTAHRAKGLEWDLVAIAHVQEQGWPDLRLRGSLLGADRIGADGLVDLPTRGALLAEERRLFYVAVTRARTRLVVTAVRSSDPDGEQPSRFLEELEPGDAEQPSVRHVVGRPRRPLSLQGIVAELRRVVADPDSPEALRTSAAERLHLLAGAEVGGRPVAPYADPSSWWGLRSATRSVVPIRPDDRPISLSASALSGLLECPAKWFLEREAGGSRVSSTNQGFGTIVHALADRLHKQEVEPDLDELMTHVDEVWGRMEFRTPWSAAREREAIQDCLRRFLSWHTRPGARVVIATEQKVRATVSLPDGTSVTLTGEADRLELDEAGDVVVVDLKTGKYGPTKQEILEHPQLGLYQLAVDAGALADVEGVPDGAGAGGAELVQLRLGKDLPRIDSQGEPEFIEEQLTRAVAAVRAEEFAARPSASPQNGHCRYCSFQPICPAFSTGSVLS